MNAAARARWSVSAVFLLHGIAVANWLARIPAVQHKLSLPVGRLGAALLCTAAGALCGMPVTARLVGRFQSAAVTRVSTYLFFLVLPLPGLVTHAWMLGPALFVFGWAAATMEIAMNTQAVIVEQGLGRPVMTTFHALFSVGGMTGAAMGGFAASLGLAPAVHLLGLVPFLLAAAWFSTRRLLSDPPAQVVHEKLHWSRHLNALWGLGTIAFCILMGEGAMADWSAVYASGLPGVTPGLAAAGYAVFSVAMAIGRFQGDRFRARFSETAIVRGGALLASAGLFAGLAQGGLAGALAGFACAGFGFSTIFPIVNFRAGQVAGISPQAGIAAVTAIGYTGFLMGPPLIGFAAQATSLRLGLCVIPMLSATAAVLSGVAMHTRTARQPATLKV